jgi:microcystin-dependent protein
MLKGGWTAMDDPIAGEIRLAAFDQIPAGWASCDGQLLQIADNRVLYDVIGTRYGGDGRRTFALPDLRGRLALHANVSYPLGAAGGKASHALTLNELPEHDHELLLDAASDERSHGAGQAGALVSYGVEDGAVTWTGPAPARAAAPHDNMQPYLGLVFMIAVVGQSPARS